ncbi:MAG: Crp/Fnr family transcriptional regulator [Chloroflexota bacterium]
MPDIESLLSGHTIFSSLDKAQQAIFQREAILRSYQKGAFIVQYGDVWPYLFVIVKGRVTAAKESGEGRSLVVATFDPGNVFWGLAFFDDGAVMPVSLEATEEASLYLWPRERILPVIFQNGKFSWELSRLMVGRMQRASDIVEELAFHPVAGRVARLLLDNFRPDQGAAPRHLTLDEMAARVGTTREMVCRILYRFAEQGAIQINRTEFIFTDRGILEEHTRRG